MKPLDPNPPAIVREDDTLDTLAGQINAAHAAGEEAIRTGITFFRQVGAMLVRAKKQVPHGQWLHWLKKNVKFSQQTANNYMRITANWSKVSGSSGMKDALRILADDGSEESKLLTVSNLESEETDGPEEVTADGDDGVANGDKDNPYRNRASTAKAAVTPTYQPSLEYDSYTAAEKEARKIAEECKELVEALCKQLPTLLDGPAGYDFRRLALDYGFPIAEEREERYKIGGRPGNVPAEEVRESWPVVEQLKRLFGEIAVINYMRPT